MLQLKLKKHVKLNCCCRVCYDFILWKPKWKENDVQPAKFIVVGQVWVEDYKNADTCASK